MSLSIEDVDSFQSMFEAVFVTTCGKVSIPAPVPAAITFIVGGGAHDQALVFRAKYPFFKSALESMQFIVDSPCSMIQHHDVMTITINNIDNPNHTVSAAIPIHIAALETPTKIDKGFLPRWHLTGLTVTETPDSSSLSASYFQAPTFLEEEGAVEEVTRALPLTHPY
jgi:hypothetical protein